MKKFFLKFITAIVLLSAAYFTFVYYVYYSEGFRAGKLVKISKKGVIFKTWEGEISQGVSEAQVFKFSVDDKQSIEKLKELQGEFVKLTYKQRYTTFPWLGDTKYYIIKVQSTEDSDDDEEDVEVETEE